MEDDKSNGDVQHDSINETGKSEEDRSSVNSSPATSPGITFQETIREVNTPMVFQGSSTDLGLPKHSVFIVTTNGESRSWNVQIKRSFIFTALLTISDWTKHCCQNGKHPHRSKVIELRVIYYQLGGKFNFA
ncbi:unnamed protein product [Allacma fusca]|uniref:Uncharacterized protein n=1 Tax=Allacma fusca TaxID=39272 RepID=A0A8J2JUU0_9HEXA|nr:unnamed protein product [Allacma fusca]